MVVGRVEWRTVAAALAGAASRLQASSDAPRLEAELLLAHVLGLSRADLYAHPERALLPNQLVHYQTLLDQRAGGKPLPYLIGHVEFCGLDFSVDPRVLIPRPETETLVDLALTLANRRPPTTDRLAIADVGTGSGCVAVALAVRLPGVRVYALDLSLDALAVARANASLHGVGDRITFMHSDLLEALSKPVDLIVANPPYVAADEWPTLPRHICEHEPRLALDGGADGLDVVRRLLEQSPACLRPGGALLVEIGAAQGNAATHLARQAFPDAGVTLHADLAGHDRVLCVQTQNRHSPTR
jgi:release factor glutamine methyltransferase